MASRADNIRSAAKDRAAEARSHAERAGKVMGDLRSKAQHQASAVRERVSRRYQVPSNSGEQGTSNASRNPHTIVPPDRDSNDTTLKMIRTRF